MAAVRGSVLSSAPLKATDVAAERWDSLKEKGDTCVLIDNLEKQGRNLEVRWQSSTIRDKCYEAERSFKPTFAEDLFDKDKVKRYVHRQLGVSVTKSNLMNSRTNVKSW